MNTRLTALSLAVAAVLGATAALAASTRHTLTVSATVHGNCKFNLPGPTTLQIANSGAVIDPSIATNATGTANIPFRCTKGTSSSIADDGGQHNSGGLRHVALPGIDTMPYGLSYAGTDVQTGSGMGSGHDLTLAVTATILVADFENASAGAYSDSVVLTISP